VLLLDEPFDALDAKVRKELRQLHNEMHATSVFATHDQDEVMEVADRVVVMKQGRIEQQGTPGQAYDHPASPFELHDLGDVNLFYGRFDHTPGSVAAAADTVYARPHELDIVDTPESGALSVTLSQVLSVGAWTRIEFRCLDDGSYVDVQTPRSEFAALRQQRVAGAARPAHCRRRGATGTTPTLRR